MHGISPYQTSADGLLKALSAPQSAIYVIAALMVVACAGYLVGILTRNIMILVGLAVIAFAFLSFHMYLPLPANIQTELFLFKARIGL